MKKTINSAAAHLYRNACEQVTDQWNKYGAEQIIEKKKSGLSTGHEEAEHIAKIQAKTKDKLTQGKDPDELIKNASNLLDEKQKQVRAKWEAKFKSQKYIIMDSEWKGSDFVPISLWQCIKRAPTRTTVERLPVHIDCQKPCQSDDFAS